MMAETAEKWLAMADTAIPSIQAEAGWLYNIKATYMYF